MLESTKKVLHLKFNLDSGKSATISVPNPKEGLTKDACQQVGETIVRDGALLSANDAKFTAFTDAYVIETRRVALV